MIVDCICSLRTLHLCYQDYALTHFIGILLTSMCCFVGYAWYTGNKPQVNTRAMVPSIASGFVWAIAQTGYFIAMTELGPETAFPVVATSPQIVAALWGVLVYHEVTGVRDLGLLVVAMLVGVAAVVCIACSRI